MTNTHLTLEAEVQRVLDELWSEELIPFALNVGKITKDIGEYTIHFHDSRICTASVPLTESQSSRDVIRSAVLVRVARMTARGKMGKLTGVHEFGHGRKSGEPGKA